MHHYLAFAFFYSSLLLPRKEEGLKVPGSQCFFVRPQKFIPGNFLAFLAGHSGVHFVPVVLVEQQAERVGVAEHHSVKAANHSDGKNGNDDIQKSYQPHLNRKGRVVKKEDVGFF